MAIIWGLTGISFIINILTRLSGSVTATMIMIILGTSTYRGFADGAMFELVALKFAGYFALMGGSLMVASRGKWWFGGCLGHEGRSMDLYYAGRILAGTFFFTAGWLHLSHITADSHILAGFPDAVFWVVLTGLCWFACAFSFWLNIMVRLASVGAIVLVVSITFMINLRGFGHGNDWVTISQIFTNISLIASCLMISAHGYFGPKPSLWWFPPQSWGFSNGICTEENCKNEDV